MKLHSGFLGLILCFTAAATAIGEPAEPRSWESLLTQPSLLDGPASLKESLREHGLNFDASWTQFYQGVVLGEAQHNWRYGGKIDLIGNVDLTRFGLWPGFSLAVHQEFNYGKDVNNAGTGLIIPANTSMALPRLGGGNANTSISLTQRFNERISLTAGKINMLQALEAVPLAGGGGNATFVNTGLAAPINGVTPPYLLGAMLSARTDPAIVGLWVYDPRNAQGRDVIEHPFGDGVTTSLSVTLPTQIAGLSGFYGVRGVYSTQEGFDFRDLPALALPSDSAAALSTKNKYWFSSVSFQQYLMQNHDNPAEGWGIFGQAGISDGNPNPFKWSVVAGLAGTSPLPSRNLDRWGIGYFYYGLSSELKEGLAALGQGVRNEYGIEAFYNHAFTPWFRLTADAQWVRPGTVGFSDAIVLGLRAQTRF